MITPSVADGSAESGLIVNGGVPGIAKPMASRPAEAFAAVIAPRRVHIAPPVGAGSEGSSHLVISLVTLTRYVGNPVASRMTWSLEKGGPAFVPTEKSTLPWPRSFGLTATVIVHVEPGATDV